MSDIPEPLQRILDRPLVPDPDEPTALANSGLAADIAADEKLITIEPCCWLCQFMKQEMVGEGGLGPGMQAYVCKRRAAKGMVVLPYNTKCEYGFQLKKELAG